MWAIVGEMAIRANLPFAFMVALYWHTESLTIDCEQVYISYVPELDVKHVDLDPPLLGRIGHYQSPTPVATRIREGPRSEKI